MKDTYSLMKKLQVSGFRMLREVQIFMEIAKLTEQNGTVKTMDLANSTRMPYRAIKKIIYKLSDKPEKGKALNVIRYHGSLGNVGKDIILTTKGKRVIKLIKEGDQ